MLLKVSTIGLAPSAHRVTEPNALSPLPMPIALFSPQSFACRALLHSACDGVCGVEVAAVAAGVGIMLLPSSHCSTPTSMNPSTHVAGAHEPCGPSGQASVSTPLPSSQVSGPHW